MTLPDPQNFGSSADAWDWAREKTEGDLIMWCFQDPDRALHGLVGDEIRTLIAKNWNRIIRHNEVDARLARLVQEGALHKSYEIVPAGRSKQMKTKMIHKALQRRAPSTNKLNQIFWPGRGTIPTWRFCVIPVWQCVECGLHYAGERQVDLTVDEAEAIIPPGNQKVFCEILCPTEGQFTKHRLKKNASRQEEIPGSDEQRAEDAFEGW